LSYINLQTSADQGVTARAQPVAPVSYPRRVVWFQNINGEPLMRLITALKLFGPELSNLIEERARARFGG
jgi:hypothetical protein